jgi:hypothetical protein
MNSWPIDTLAERFSLVDEKTEPSPKSGKHPLLSLSTRREESLPEKKPPGGDGERNFSPWVGALAIVPP